MEVCGIIFIISIIILCIITSLNTTSAANKINLSKEDNMVICKYCSTVNTLESTECKSCRAILPSKEEIFKQEFTDKSVEELSQNRYNQERLVQGVEDKKWAINERVTQLHNIDLERKQLEATIRAERERMLAQELWNAQAPVRRKKNITTSVILIVIISLAIFACCILPVLNLVIRGN